MSGLWVRAARIKGCTCVWSPLLIVFELRSLLLLFRGFLFLWGLFGLCGFGLGLLLADLFKGRHVVEVISSSESEGLERKKRRREEKRSCRRKKHFVE